jgi:uncharacterized lipoprotein YbaY
MPRIRGQVRFPVGQRPPKAAAVVVTLEDVTMADAPAVVVSRHRQEDVSLPADDVEPLRVDLSYATPLEAGHRYNVRVHVDVTGTGTVTAGDFVTVQANPVQPDTDVVSLGVHQV